MESVSASLPAAVGVVRPLGRQLRGRTQRVVLRPPVATHRVATQNLHRLNAVEAEPTVRTYPHLVLWAVVVAALSFYRC
jgi:hypothetical protein